MKCYDFLIVGAGLFGATFAYKAKQAGKKCLVIDKRKHIGGNTYCENIYGINVHKYGAHIFHTSNKEIWDFVNSLVPFNNYINSPLANYKGDIYNLPFNMNTFHQMWNINTPNEAENIINEQRKELNGKEPKNLEEQAISLVGRDIYDILIKGYTEKQWGRKCSELPSSIIKRLPLRFTYNNNYFNDTYQGIPIGGYNKLIEKLLEGVDVKLDCNFFDHKTGVLAEKIIYTGPIDEFYDYQFGHLEYRTVTFNHEVILDYNYQGNAVINYTDKKTPYTRIIEHKHFETFGDSVYDNPVTVISKEYSLEWKPGMEPYYPINDNKNNRKYNLYKELADNEPDVFFGGRLAEYKYYDMAPTIESAIKLAEKIIK